MAFFALTVLIKLSENIIKRSKLSSKELIVEAIEKANKQIHTQTNLIKDLTERIEELENRAECTDENLDCIHRALEAA